MERLASTVGGQPAARRLGVVGLAVVMGLGLGGPRGLAAQAWRGFAGDPQHTGNATVVAQPLARVRWSTLIDLERRYSGNDLLIHYGTPLVTRGNTVIIPVKTGLTGGFRIDAFRSDTGARVWSEPTAYSLPQFGWIPSVGATLTRRERLMFPGPGGTVHRRGLPNRADGRTTQRAFYGIQHYLADSASFDQRVRITTPLTADRRDTLYFGFVAAANAPLGLQSGIARLAPGHRSSWISAAAAAGDPEMRKVPYNCAPAVSKDGKIVYVAVNDQAGTGFGAGYLLALDSRTLETVGRVRLKDVKSPERDATIPDDGSASPTVGPDGDVYYGVLETPIGSNNLRGWMLHFDALLTQVKPPAAYGWDSTPSIVPASAVPSYTGTSSYLLLTKYQNYAPPGGDGINRMAVLDPHDTMTDPISGATVMKEILTIAGPTPDEELRAIGYPLAVEEWCVNTSAVDARSRAAFMTSEDGRLYRWDLATNTLPESIQLTDGLGEAYTPTAMGPDGSLYAISNGILFAVGE